SERQIPDALSLRSDKRRRGFGGRAIGKGRYGSGGKRVAQNRGNRGSPRLNSDAKLATFSTRGRGEGGESGVREIGDRRRSSVGKRRRDVGARRRNRPAVAACPRARDRPRPTHSEENEDQDRDEIERTF